MRRTNHILSNLFLSLLILGLFGPVAANEEGPPVEVDVGFHLLDLNSINTEDETFSINGYLYYTWLKEARPDSWYPRIHPVNAQQFSVFYEDFTEGNRDGKTFTVMKIAFKAVLNSQFDFQRFPFDSSRLQFYLEPSDERGQVRLLVDPADFSRDPLVFDAQWKLKKIDAKLVALAKDAPDGADRVLTDLYVERKPHYHVWYYFLPLILITATSWTVFWYTLPNPQVTVVSMLGLVAYNMVFAQHLPQLGFLTVADAFFLLCLLGNFLATLCCTVVLWGASSNQAQKVERFGKLCRIFLPLTQILVSLLLVRFWGH